jgi:hypothetical protein
MMWPAALMNLRLNLQKKKPQKHAQEQAEIIETAFSV